MKRWVKEVATSLGVGRLMTTAPLRVQYPPDASPLDREVLDRINGFTMTSLPRQMSLIQAVRYIAKNRIPGSFVECGVWRGGSSMAMAMTLMQEGDTSRDIHMFDTYQGMTEPQEVDKRLQDGLSAKLQLDQDTSRNGEVWATATLEDVKRNVQLINYPVDRVQFIEGPVESTIPEKSPKKSIALLRLDTDWYESTRHELIHLFPKLSPGGILIIDDYGHWEGAKKAVDEYFGALERKYFFHRIDYTGRLIVNTATA